MRQGFFISSKPLKKTFFLKLLYYVYLLGKHHNMSPLNKIDDGNIVGKFPWNSYIHPAWFTRNCFIPSKSERMNIAVSGELSYLNAIHLFCLSKHSHIKKTIHNVNLQEVQCNTTYSSIFLYMSNVLLILILSNMMLNYLRCCSQ